MPRSVFDELALLCSFYLKYFWRNNLYYALSLCVIVCVHSINIGHEGIIYLGGFPVPRGVRIPKIIRDLNTYDTRINFTGYLFLEMQGGVTGFGVRIYPEGFKTPNRYFSYGNRELLPGLWYYDYGYSHDPEYNKRIEQIIKEGKWEEADESNANQQ